MKLRYLGTGAAEGVPALFCNCAYCAAAKRRGGRELRSRAQLLIDGEFSVDFPPDAFYHAARFREDFSALKYILVTHAHMDHFYAHDFVLRGYKYAWDMRSPSLEVYGNRETGEIFRESTRREMKPQVMEHLSFHEIEAFCTYSFGGYVVHTFAAKHSSREPLLFLIEKDGKRLLHLCDTGGLPPESERSLLALGGKPCDAVTLDCTFLWDRTAADARHMGLDADRRVVETLERAGLADGATKKIITHFSHNASPSPARIRRAEREYGFIAAYDGMELEL